MASEQNAEQNNPKVLLFPFLAHGHITPFFELAKNLIKHKFSVYFCSTPINLKTFSTKLDRYSVNQVEFNLEESPELPPHYHTTTGLPAHLIFSLVDAVENSGPTFSSILESVQPDLVIYDVYQPWLPTVAASHDIPAVYFQTTSVANCSQFLHAMKYPDLEFPFKAIFKTEFELNSQRRVKNPNEDVDKVKKNFLRAIEESTEVMVMRSSIAFEEKYIEYQSTLLDKKMVSLGTLVSDPNDDVDEDSEIIQWLNGKEEGSIVFVSFGSEVVLTKEELEEVALGLEMSNVNFIWVLRSHGKDKIILEEVLPEGFLDRIKGKGFVGNVWAPQTKILKHPSIGVFVSHCGWGSTVESITFGVPIVAMPMQYDQFVNARLVGELGVGFEVARDENGQRKREEIGRTIEEVLLKDEGEKIRIKARDLGEKVRVKSEEEIDVAVQQLKEICLRNKNPLS